MNVELRCRLTQGDIGPFPVARTLTVLGVKEQLLRRWPQGAGDAHVKARLRLPAPSCACAALLRLPAVCVLWLLGARW